MPAGAGEGNQVRPAKRAGKGGAFKGAPGAWRLEPWRERGRFELSAPPIGGPLRAPSAPVPYTYIYIYIYIYSIVYYIMLLDMIFYYSISYYITPKPLRVYPCPLMGGACAAGHATLPSNRDCGEASVIAVGWRGAGLGAQSRLPRVRLRSHHCPACYQRCFYYHRSLLPLPSSTIAEVMQALPLIMQHYGHITWQVVRRPCMRQLIQSFKLQCEGLESQNRAWSQPQHALLKLKL